MIIEMGGKKVERIKYKHFTEVSYKCQTGELRISALENEFGMQLNPILNVKLIRSSYRYRTMGEFRRDLQLSLD